MIKDVIFMGKDGVRHIGLADRRRIAMVSILDESEYPRPNLTGFSTILCLTFTDVHEGMFRDGPRRWGDDPSLVDLQFAYSASSREAVAQGPSMEHARRIMAFCQRVQDEPEELTLAVHCYAGVSRSAAVARFVSETFLVPIDSHRTTECANPRLMHLLRRARTEMAAQAELPEPERQAPSSPRP